MNILYIVENAVDSGGNRVIFIKIKESIKKGNKVEVAYILRRISRIKDLFGFFKDYIGMVLKYRGVKIKLLNQPISTENYNQVVTTGRRCLEFLNDISSYKHIHLIQHLEVWSTFNSQFFIDLSKSKGYASSDETLKCVYLNDCPEEQAYISRLKKIKTFETVSEYLKRILLEINSTATINVKEPPEISYPLNQYSKKIKFENRNYDILFLLRGLKFKGDDLVLDLINAIIEKKYKLKIAIVVSGKAKFKFKNSQVSYFINPSNIKMAGLYSESKILVNPSLTEGFGAVPREAILYGCKCITSNTGWLQDFEKNDKNIEIINKHKINLYLDAIDKMMNDI